MQHHDPPSGLFVTLQGLLRLNYNHLLQVSLVTYQFHETVRNRLSQIPRQPKTTRIQGVLRHNSPCSNSLALLLDPRL